MSMSEYWSALGVRGRTGLLVGGFVVGVATLGGGYWLLRDAQVLLSSGLSAERLSTVVQELDREKIAYRIGEDGHSIEVPRSKLGKAKAAVSSSGLGLPANVGLELFKETDFSTTDFAQKINYQRALQGELTRTLQAISGVRSARVHVILPDGGVFKRSATRASAAIEVAMIPGRTITRAQVRGMQRLVVASVPDIRIEDIVVLDESGTALTRVGPEADGDLSASQLDLKRQVDDYLQGKLARLLEDISPGAAPTWSVDATLDYRHLKVTTEEPIAGPAAKEAEHATGVLVKERQSQRLGAALTPASGDAVVPETTDSEYEYKVGQRLEQAVSVPGSIKRLSVAVTLKGAPPELTATAVEHLVSHGVGIDRSRGDSVAVLLLPGLPATQAMAIAASPPAEAPSPPMSAAEPPRAVDAPVVASMGGVVVIAGAFALLLGWSRRRRAAAEAEAEIDVRQTTARVRAWLETGAHDGPT
jgi:flagellar M-ring protein FliF